jgi:shikimate kinase
VFSFHVHAGVVVWLNGPTDLLAKRVAKDGLAKRPLLAPEGTSEGQQVSEDALFQSAKSRLDSLLAERTQFYESADLKISLEGEV